MNDEAYKRLGEVLVDELLLRAGLAQTDASSVSFAVEFDVETDKEARSVVLRCSRTNTTPLELRFPLPDVADT